MEPMFQQAGLALLLGLLVGLQREHAASGIAGMRTFPLIALLGTVAAGLAKQFGGWVVAAGFLGIAALIAIHSPKALRRSTNGGTTTDVTMLLMYAVGALLVTGPIAVAVAIGGAAAVLLQFKPELHGFAKRLGDQDLRAIMQFVLITCIILPLLPQRTIALWPDPPYGYLNVFNPFEIWLMVVLIVGMNLGGYILYKFLGQDAGTLFGGILGGAISSTATTVSYARMVRNDPAYARERVDRGHDRFSRFLPARAGGRGRGFSAIPDYGGPAAVGADDPDAGARRWCSGSASARNRAGCRRRKIPRSAAGAGVRGAVRGRAAGAGCG